MPRTPNTDVPQNALVTLVQSDAPLTRQALGLSNHYIAQLVEAGHIAPVTDKTGRVVGQKVTNEAGEPQRGRPSTLFKLTGNGRKKANRILAKRESDAEAPVVESEPEVAEDREPVLA